MDLFPIAKQAILIEDTMSGLLYIYAYFNMLLDKDHQTILFDDLLTQAFASNISCLFYPQVAVDDTMISMQQALQQGLIDRVLNILEVAQQLSPNAQLNTASLLRSRQLLELNSIEVTDSLDLKDDNPSMLEALQWEAKIVDYIATVIREIMEQGLQSADIYSLVDFAISNRYNHPEDEEAIRRIIQLPGLNLLLIAIIFNDVSSVERNITLFDPRNNKHKAYFLAVDKGNEQIINILKNNIIYRNFLEQEVFTTQIQQTRQITNLPTSIYNYSKRLYIIINLT